MARNRAASGAADVKGIHQQLCNVGGGVDRRHHSLRDWVKGWLTRVCHVPWADTEQHVAEWDKDGSKLTMMGAENKFAVAFRTLMATKPA